MTKKLLSILTVSLLLSNMLVFGQSAIDERVKKNLDELKFKYKVKDDGTFQFTVPIDNRSQMVFLHSQTSTYDALEIREVYSVIYQSKDKPSEAILGTLLLDNSHKKLGAWELIYEDNIYFIVFTLKIDAGQNARDLKSIIDIVVASADAMEQELFIADEW